MIYFQIALTVFIAISMLSLVLWIFRPGSEDKYREYSKIPLDHE